MTATEKLLQIAVQMRAVANYPNERFVVKTARWAEDELRALAARLRAGRGNARAAARMAGGPQ